LADFNPFLRQTKKMMEIFPPGRYNGENAERAVKGMLSLSWYDSPIGKLLLSAGEDTLTGAWFDGQKYFPTQLPGQAAWDDLHPVLLQAKDWLDRYFSGQRPDPAELNLAPEGSEFRRQVWNILLRIPYGQVTTYGAIAKELAEQRSLSSLSAQAVGGAVGHNPISIIIPCHRVLGSGGKLTGYAGGLNAKIWLLSHEGVLNLQ
jgi:methylated-DNA-[protein]-cysteine S-methyltransferase